MFAKLALRFQEKGALEDFQKWWLHQKNDDPDSLYRSTAEIRLAHQWKIGVYSYLKDNYHSQTVGDAEEVLRQHMVDPEVVGCG